MDSTSTFEASYRDLHRWGFTIGACFAVVAIILSLYLVFHHLRSYTVSEEQKWIVGVIFMVPVYATDSVISLWNPRLSLVFDTLRDCYEAFALYSFGSYLVACLGGERRVNEILESKSRKSLETPLLEGNGSHIQGGSFLNFFLKPCAIGRDLFTIEKFGLVQYMILKTLCALLAFVLETCGVYGDGEFKWYLGYPYITLILNFSQIWALYCLVQFYNVVHHKLSHIRPLAKFISFKAIVFATWWQGVAIALLCYFRILPKEEKLQTILQEFLICIEMSIAAVAHMFVFSAEPYRRMRAAKGGTASPTIITKTETKVEAEGTSIRESVEDIVVQGGQCVMKDVVLTINQAMGPVEKGVTKIQETFMKKSESSEEEEAVDVKVEKRVDKIT